MYEINDKFQVNVAQPIDSRLVVIDITARNAIPTGVRYLLMKVSVESDGKTYTLKAGVTNSDWVEDGNSNATTGASGSVDEEIPVFSGTTGKLIKQSGAKWDVTNKRFDMVTPTDTMGFNSKVRFYNTLTFNAASDSTTGSNATLATLATKYIRLTNASLVSISMIPGGSAGQEVVLVNETGVDLTINNDSGGTSSDRILTGTQNSITLKKEAALALVYNSGLTRWCVVGSPPSTGVGSLSEVFSLYGDEQLSTWSTGNNATYLGGGTLNSVFAYETTTPLHGKQSYKLTLGASSLNDYIASPVMAVDKRFRGIPVLVTFPYLYDGSATDVTLVVWDVTNGTKLTTDTANLLPAATTNSTYRAVVTIPATCTQIRMGFQVKATNSGKILQFDDVVMTSDVVSFANSTTVTDWVTYSISSIASTGTSPTFGNVTNNIAKWRRVGGEMQIAWDYAQNTAGSAGTGMFLFPIPSGFQIDLTRAPASTATVIANEASGSLGSIYIAYYAGGLPGTGIGVMSAYDSTRLKGAVKIGTTGTSNDVWGTNTSGFSVTPATINIRVSVPILGWSASVPNIIQATDQVSSDSIAFTYANAATYTLATLANAPIGTYITFSGAANSLTETQTTGTSRPTQTDADMATNGFLVYTKAYNAASTAAQPAVMAIQIGKGFKNVSVNLYKSAGRSISGSLDMMTNSSGFCQGLSAKEYNETTGVLVIRATPISSAFTSYQFGFADLTNQSSGYITFSASKSANIVGFTPYLTNQDVEITDTTKGIILRAPNGSRYRGTVGNTGTVTWTLV